MSDSPRHCRACAYELTGVAPTPDAGHEDDLTHRCPECGRPFDPRRPETTRPAPTPLWRRPRTRIVARRLTLAAAFLFCVAMSWIPRPAGDDWTQWVWLGEHYGYDVRWNNARRTRYDVRADQLVRVTAGVDAPVSAFTLERLDNNRFRLSVSSENVEWHEIGAALSDFDIEGVFERYDAGPGERSLPLFSVEGDAAALLDATFDLAGVQRRFVLRRSNDDHWSLRVDDPRVHWQSLINAFNSMRGALYGVRIEGGAPARSAQAPFRAEGAAADILWAIVEAYDLALSDPTRVPPRSDGWHPVGTFVSDPMQKEAPAQGLKMVRNIDRWGFEPVPRIPPPPSSPVSPGPSSMAPPRR